MASFLFRWSSYLFPCNPYSNPFWHASIFKISGLYYWNFDFLPGEGTLQCRFFSTKFEICLSRQISILLQAVSTESRILEKKVMTRIQESGWSEGRFLIGMNLRQNKGGQINLSNICLTILSIIMLYSFYIARLMPVFVIILHRNNIPVI